jgi:alkylation response protein AidB-like acyl-CoA dehydrogenase
MPLGGDPEGPQWVDDPLLRDELVRRWMDARVTAAQSVIKAAWSRTTVELGETVLRCSGPAGLREDDEGVQQFLRSRAATIAAGTTEIMKNLLAEQVLGLPKGREPRWKRSREWDGSTARWSW